MQAGKLCFLLAGMVVQSLCLLPRLALGQLHVLDSLPVVVRGWSGNRKSSMISCCFFQFQFFSLCECIYLLGSITCNIESRCYNPVLSFVLLNVRCLLYGLCTPVFYKSPCIVTVIQKYLFLMEEETVKKGHEKICAPGSTKISKVSKGINISNF